MRRPAPSFPASRGGSHVPADIVDGWQTHAVEEHRRLVAAGRAQEAVACAALALERLHRDLGAPPEIDGWVHALDDDLRRTTLAPSLTDREVFRAGLAVLGRCPRHPALPLWHARALAMIAQPDGLADDTIAAARFAFEYAVRGGNFAQAREIVTKARAQSTGASVDMHVGWLESEALEAWLSGDHARAHHAVRQAIAAGGGYAAWEQGASAAISEGDLDEADRCLAAMAQSIDARRTQDVAHMHFLAAARARIGGDDGQARAHLDACLAQDRTNVPEFFATLWQLGNAHLHVATGQHRAAGSLLAVILGRSASHYWSYLRFSAFLSRTWLRVRQRRTSEAAEDLAHALSLARRGLYRNCDPWWDREAMDDIARFARTIEHDSSTLQSLLARKE
jgi:hypothetical protein